MRVMQLAVSRLLSKNKRTDSVKNEDDAQDVQICLLALTPPKRAANTKHCRL